MANVAAKEGPTTRLRFIFYSDEDLESTPLSLSSTSRRASAVKPIHPRGRTVNRFSTPTGEALVTTRYGNTFQDNCNITLFSVS
jgi:hypothetical protein